MAHSWLKVQPSMRQRHSRSSLLLLLLLPSASAFGRLFQTLFNRTSTESAPCKDDADGCGEWAADGECLANRMRARRRRAFPLMPPPTR